MTCRNCHTDFNGNYCNNCGQSAKTKRFSFKYFVRESFASSLDIENGFFLSFKLLLLNPGKSIKAYIQGSRVSLYPPAKFLILSGAIATFLAIRYRFYSDSYIAGLSELSDMDPKGFLNFAEEYATLINALTIPIFAFFSYLFFKSKGYNYTENLVLNMYITVMQMMGLLFFVPFLEFFPDFKGPILIIYTLGTLLYNVWAYLDFFDARNSKGVLTIALILIASYLTQYLVNNLIFLLITQASWL
ncbi:DUF3667 domain-containing protein [Fulvivirgaceae bacterium BMA10]|uniref:DUF3667 domain-containing protein n=1 Tax=Splendidivirga corallicola TaxID=3051826 RepID=A0ABT8KJH0_9BACT|nr:DUF3667 domain-containing protein [Fulvivirgaceae bacterium BMA10]